MKSTTRITTALLIAMGLLTASAGQAASSRLVARCSGGGYTVKVREFAGQGHAMYVYQGSALALSRWAARSISDTGGVRISQYSAGSPLQGGADLRVRSRADRNPDTEGYAHLTFQGRNNLMTCTVYQ